MRVALVHDFLTKNGGAERVLVALHKIYPDAPVYTLLYDQKGTKNRYKDWEIRTSNLQKLPGFIRKPRFLLSQLAPAIEEFDFSSFDLVVSSSNSFAHGIITPAKTFHLSYCHSPMRYAWDWCNEYLKENKIGFGLKGMLIRYLIHKIRIWDKIAADRVDCWVANSANVQKRIKKYYQKDSTIVYPPVDTENIRSEVQKPKDFYLIISRLEPYKNIRAAVEAFNQVGKKLIIIGEGSEFSSLQQIAKGNINLLGWQDDQTVRRCLTECKALVFPGEDDFGITPVESMAAGRPVIALRKGGALETVIEGKTGIFIEGNQASDIVAAVRKYELHAGKFEAGECRKQALTFSEDNFRKSMQAAVDQGLLNYKKRMGERG